jgi:flagellin
MNTAMERLSTGLRINSAADDAAGLQISNRLEMQNRGMSVAMRNAQDSISLLQTAEGAMDEMTNIAYRMNDLATQAANGTNTQTDRDALDAEFQELATELNNIYSNTNFGGRSIFDGADADSLSKNSVTFQIGSTTNETLTVDVNTELQAIGKALESYAALDTGREAYDATYATEMAGGVGTAYKTAYDAHLAVNVGDTAGAEAAGKVAAEGAATTAGDDAIAALTPGNFGTDFSTATLASLEASHSIDSQTGATANMTSISGLIDGLGEARAQFGANINRLEHTITNLQNMSENLAASKGRITDTDYAVESANMTKQQMLMQAGTQMLAQSKQLPGMAMSLLG